MPQKDAIFMTCGTDERCDDIRKFIEDAGIRMTIRNIKEEPLSVRELVLLFGHNPLSYFINPASEEYSKLGLDRQLPERDDLLKLMADNPGLLRVPIIKTVRLVIVGCNREKVAEMLQISRNGDQPQDTEVNRGRRITRRSLAPRK